MAYCEWLDSVRQVTTYYLSRLQSVFAPPPVPIEAVAFLGTVGTCLVVLIIFYLFLNKLFCFASCGGFPCFEVTGSKKELKSSKLGNAYAYDDQETSSDSDDEVLKRYQNSLVNQPGTVKPAASSRSIKSLHSRKSVQLNERSSDTLGKNKVILAEKGDEKILVEGSGSDVASEAGDSSVQEPVSSQGDSVSPQDQDQTADREGFDNQAFQGEVSPTHSALSDRTHSMGSPDRTSDEHLFDVSDLHQEPPLISKCGSLEVTFAYDAVKSKMKIIIHQAREIPSKDRGGANNSQVRLLLLPTKKQRHKTKIRTGENPIYDDTFVFHKIPKENLMNMGVRFRLYGCERMRRERMIGESIIGFASLNPDIESTHWVVLEPRSNLSHGDSRFDVSSLSRSDSASSTQSMQHGGMPELLLGLSYNGTTGRLMVEVVKGSNFRNMAMNRAPDTYVKLTMMSPTGQEISRSKTSIRRGQPNPLFKETFVFQVALFQLPEVTLMVSVYNKRSMKRKEMIGWFSLGMNSSGEEELSHWSDMRENKGDQVCRWHVLLES